MSIDADSLGTAPGPDDTAGASAGEGVPIPAPRRRRFTKGRVVLGVVALVLILAVVSSFVSLPYYALTPGSAQNVGLLIKVPGSLDHNHSGSVNLVDVEETPLRAIDFLYFKLDDHATIISSQALQGPETNAQAYIEGVLDMADAQQAAQVVALRELGYSVTVSENGDLVYEIGPGSPAATALSVGDVIIAVDSKPVATLTSLTDALAGRAPGSGVTLTYRPYAKGGSRQATFKLGTWRILGTGANATPDCVPTDVKTSLPLLGDKNGQFYVPAKGQKVSPASCVGLLNVEQSYDISKLPFAVDLSSEGIIGPSAGLAFTLGLMQKLDTADLTGGLKVACTGTMSINGQVGEIGGIEQKTFAVRAAGAKIFLVPPGNYAEAEKYAGPSLKIYSVSSITEALKVLESHGGKIVKPGAS
ncbi:MAG: PDZ domain-containing protein [Acidimicrobiales bacterium]